MVKCDFYHKCKSAGLKCNSCQRNMEKGDYYIPENPWYPHWQPYTPIYRRQYHYIGDPDPNQQDYYITTC